MFVNRRIAVGIALAVIGAGALTLALVFRTANHPISPPVVRETAPPTAPGPAHQPMPKLVKGVYLTARTVQTKRFNDLLNFVDQSELNSVVIDLKDGDGALAFATENPALRLATSTAFLPPLEALTDELHGRGIYAIARVFVFEDPWYADHSSSSLKTADGKIWADKKGIHWNDPADQNVWRYNVAIAREAWERGFDEIQFDYIRFPTDGKINDIVYPVWDGREPKREVIRNFFKYLHDELVTKNIPVSVDLFGYTVRLDEDDLGIGQHSKDALPYVTAISPMVYPSHYYAGSYGFAKPAEHPGEIVAESMRIARQLEASSTPGHASFRPWLQDFNIGAKYDAPMVRAQIDAAEAGGASGWLLWNARNVYTEDALKLEAASGQ